MRGKLVKYWLRALGVAVIILLLMFILNIVFAFKGNPMHMGRAERNILRYAGKNFDLKDFNVSECRYRFKDNRYYISFQSKSSRDTFFNIEYDVKDDKIDMSDYETRIVKRKNTIDRLTAEKIRQIRATIDTIYPKAKATSFEEISVRFMDAGDRPLTSLPLDATLNDVHGFPAQLTCKISVQSKKNFDLALDIRVLHRIMSNQGLEFTYYTFVFNKLLDSTILNLRSAEIEIPALDEKLKELKQRTGFYSPGELKPAELEGGQE